MIRRTALGLAMSVVILACSPAAGPTLTALPSLATPGPTGAAVVVRAGGRYHCEWVVGCGVFIEFAPASDLVPGDPSDWQPRNAVDLRIGHAQGEHGDSWIEVFDTEGRIPPVAPGMYRVVAGGYWVDDTNTPGPEDSFPVVDVPAPCATPLRVDPVSHLVTVVVQLEPDGTCSILASAEPVDHAIPVTFSATGELDCLSHYGCQAVLSILPLAEGATPPPAWHEHARVEFETTFQGWRRFAGTAIDPPTSLGPGRYVVLAGTRMTSDVASHDPDGNVIFQEMGGTSCDERLLVGPEAISVAIEVDFDVAGASCAIRSTLE